MGTLLEVKNLSVSFKNNESRVRAVDNVSYEVGEREVVCFVGESGSGKSVTQLASMQLIASPPGKIEAGQVLLEGEDLLALPASGVQMQKVRGGKIGIVFQEPMTSLNPVKTIGSQILEPVLKHTGLEGEDARRRVTELLTQVGIPDAASRFHDYPHQFSGGMRQRIMVAIAMAGNPKLLIADEPTTALDVTTQAQILELLRESTIDAGASLLLVTHNLGIVARYADRIYVMYAGSIVESGRAEDIFARPSHPYTRGLLQAVPRLDDRRDRRLIPIEGAPATPASRPAGCPFHPRCPYATDACKTGERPTLRPCGESGHASACIFSREELDRLEASRADTSRRVQEKKLGEPILTLDQVTMRFPVTRGMMRKTVGYVTAANRISFQVRQGETFGLVGESGCGKTTVARCILQLYKGYEGSIHFRGSDLAGLKGKQLRQERRKLQMIFQDPYSSLNPRRTVGAMVGEPLKIHGLVRTQEEYDRRVAELFELVGLDPSLRDRVPHEFSGGQRQRVGIARALASNPDLIVCDEPISALDVSIQAQIINLLEDLQRNLGISYLFIAHDLSVVKHISDRIAVMYLGNLVETAPCDLLYDEPLHPYTKALLTAVPIPDPIVERGRERAPLQGEIPSVLQRPKGCCFSDRCPLATERCRQEAPELKELSDGHCVACFRV